MFAGSGYSLSNTPNSESPKTANLIFQLCSNLYYACENKLLWPKEVHSLLIVYYCPLWSDQVHCIKSFKRILRQRLRDRFLQEWQKTISLIYLLNLSLRQMVLKFRLSNHRLPVQHRRSLGIPRDEGICTVCDSGAVGDEFLYLLNIVPVKMLKQSVLST